MVPSALFLVWFLGGAVLHYVGFPELSNAGRLAREQPISLDRVLVAPAAAIDLAHGDDLRLVSVAGGPVYIVSRRGGAPMARLQQIGRRYFAQTSKTARMYSSTTSSRTEFN